jgi:hypothetical protein
VAFGDDGLAAFGDGLPSALAPTLDLSAVVVVVTATFAARPEPSPEPRATTPTSTTRAATTPPATNFHRIVG